MEQISVRFPHLLTVQKCQSEAAVHPHPLPHPRPRDRTAWLRVAVHQGLPESSNSLSGENAAGKKGARGSIGRLDANE